MRQSPGLQGADRGLGSGATGCLCRCAPDATSSVGCIQGRQGQGSAGRGNQM